MLKICKNNCSGYLSHSPKNEFVRTWSGHVMGTQNDFNIGVIWSLSTGFDIYQLIQRGRKYVPTYTMSLNSLLISGCTLRQIYDKYRAALCCSTHSCTYICWVWTYSWVLALGSQDPIRGCIQDQCLFIPLFFFIPVKIKEINYPRN